MNQTQKAGASSTHSKRCRAVSTFRRLAKRLECVRLAGAFGSWSRCAVVKPWRLPMNRGLALKDSKRPGIAFHSSMNALNLWDSVDGSWPQCAFTCWRSRLPTNHMAGRVTPCAPSPQSPIAGAHGVTRPATKAWFRGSKRECYRRILTLTHHPMQERERPLGVPPRDDAGGRKKRNLPCFPRIFGFMGSIVQE